MKALLIVDMLVDFIEPQGALYIGAQADQLTQAVKERLTDYRAGKDLIIYICDRHLADDREFEMFSPHSLEGAAGAEIVKDLKPLPTERVIHKRRYSAFFGTDLDLTLRENGITEVELVGCVTNICILYTAAEARMLNYSVRVAEKAVASFNPEAHRFALQEMKNTLGVKLI